MQHAMPGEATELVWRQPWTRARRQAGSTLRRWHRWKFRRSGILGARRPRACSCDGSLKAPASWRPTSELWT